MFPRLKLSNRATVGYGILFSFFWIYEIAQSLYCICHSCYQNVYLNGIRAWVIDEKAHSMFKDWIHITNYCVCKLNDIGNLHFNLWPELNLGFLIASSSVGGVGITPQSCMLRTFFYIIQTITEPTNKKIRFSWQTHKLCLDF